MKNNLLRIHVWLCLILIGGFGQAYAHQEISAAAAKAGVNHDGFATSLYSHTALINYTKVHFEKQQETIELSQNENEEEELSISKLHLVKKPALLNDYRLSAYYANAPGVFTECPTRATICNTPFHSLFSRQYILFRVIRI
ncbi:hypothetical protein [uncultured Flavobacterium sp.]|uniref:hypothetical protein n=1 Tax=uncultured Flavobacterium sp. TaxID=165435 RepID=UPI0025CFAD51|nr:hypothetical protein [uncultured Flavobacterium sp.]